MAIICSNCRNYSYSAHKTLCTQFIYNAYFMALILVPKRKSQNSIYALLTLNYSKISVTAAFFLFCYLSLISYSPGKYARELHMALICQKMVAFAFSIKYSQRCVFSGGHYQGNHVVFIHSFRICWRMSVSAAAGLTWGRSGGANSS